MKYCFECGRMTAGEPLFCNFCGRSYDVKLCPRHHVNPRVADVCSQCGSRELSTPHPKVSPLWKVAAFFLKVLVGLSLLYIALAVLLAALQGIVSSPQFLNVLVPLGILVGLLWWIWSQIPDWMKKLVRRSKNRKEHGNGR